MTLEWWTHVVRHLSKLTEFATPRVILMSTPSLVSNCIRIGWLTKCTSTRTDVNNRGNSESHEGCMVTLYFHLSFSEKPKTAPQNNKVYELKTRGKRGNLGPSFEQCCLPLLWFPKCHVLPAPLPRPHWTLVVRRGV